MSALALSLALWLAPAPDAAADLARLEAAVAAAPADAEAHRALGLLLAGTYVSPDAIAVLRRAVELGLPPAAADEARMWVAFLLLEGGRDPEAVAECRALLDAWPPEHPQRGAVEGLLGSIATRHAALAGVTASERRATIALVLILVGFGGGWWFGRRRARLAFPDPSAGGSPER